MTISSAASNIPNTCSISVALSVGANMITTFQRVTPDIQNRMCCVRCSAIYGISYRYHRCGTICMLEDKAKCRRSSYEWHLGYLGAIGFLNQRWYLLTPRLGTSSLLGLHVDVWRLIFLKLSLPRHGVRGCSCTSLLCSLCAFIL
jgi:hypothetical protein